MKSNAQVRRSARLKRQQRVRKRLKGTDARPRVTVFRSLKNTYVQLISDESGKVIAQASSREVCADGKSAASRETASLVGKLIAERAKEAKIENAVFDRNGYLYHGRVAAVADGAREAGLVFSAKEKSN